jgi:exodeoxyribonuclease VII large subunit
MKKVFSVTELNGQIKHLLEESFDLFWVEGEVSNLHRPASGHVYFTLKVRTARSGPLSSDLPSG